MRFGRGSPRPLLTGSTKPQYVMRRQMMEEELQRTKPPTDPDLDRAQAPEAPQAYLAQSPATGECHPPPGPLLKSHSYWS